MRAKLCTHTLLALVATLFLGINEVTLAQTTTKTTVTKKASKKSSKKEDKKTTTEVAPPAPSATAPAPATPPLNIPALETKIVSVPESAHKFSGFVALDYLFEPLAKDPNTETLEKQYKKQRAILTIGSTYLYNKTWSLNFIPEFRYNNNHQNGNYATNPGRLEFTRALATIIRKDVLTEKDHGIKLDLGYVRRFWNLGVNPNSYGNHRLRAVVAKSLNDKLNFSITNDFMYNAPKSWAKKTKNPETETLENNNWKFSYNMLPTINYSITDKLTYTFLGDLNYSIFHKDINGLHKSDFASENSNILNYTYSDTYSFGNNFKYVFSSSRKGNPYQSLYIAPFVTMNVTPTTNISLELSWLYSQANDSEEGIAPKRNFHQYPDFAIYFYRSI